MLSGQTPARVWNTRRTEKQRRLASVPVQGKVLPTADLTAVCSHQTRIGNLDAHLI